MKSLSRNYRFLICISVSLIIYLLPIPIGLSVNAWKLLAIFLGTIFTVMSGVFPMGAASLMGLTAAVLTKSLTFKQAFSGFISPITWLILCAFFISFGFVHTGLGKRIALFFISVFGKSPLGLAYGIGLTDLILAPGTPSSTARSGGIIFPIVDSINRSMESFPHNESRKKIGSYLIVCLFNFSVITSAMFMTAMAGNPFAAKLAHKAFGIEITWSSWALHAIIPGLLNLILVPIFIAKIFGPTQKDTRHAAIKAKEDLKSLGKMKPAEKMMSIGFLILMVLWVFGSLINVTAEIAALAGLSFLLISNVFTWDQLLRQHSAFETFIWFGALMALATGLSSTGFADWFGVFISAKLSLMPAVLGILLLFLIYFYSHYLFASCTAHVGALFIPFMSGALALGADILPMALAFCFASSLFGCLTHYGIGPAPILFGAGYLTLKEWWRVGFLVSIFNILIWSISSFFWWNFLGTL